MEDAIKYYERSLVNNSEFEIAHNNLAVAYTDMGTKVKNSGDLEQGVAFYKRALLHNPKYSDAWYNLGVANVGGESGCALLLSPVFSRRLITRPTPFFVTRPALLTIASAPKRSTIWVSFIKISGTSPRRSSTMKRQGRRIRRLRIL